MMLYKILVRVILTTAMIMLYMILASSFFLYEGSQNFNTEEIDIGDQTWTAHNVALKRYRNGDPIPYAESTEELWDYGSKGIGAWCYPDGDEQLEQHYGLLYNWHVITDDRGFTPEGWSVPESSEWDELVNFLGADSAGFKMKTSNGWANNGNGSNESRFNAVPTGFRWHTGEYEGKGIYGSWWTSTKSEYDEYYAWIRGVGADYDNIYTDSSSTYFAFSIRLIKND